MSYDAIGIVFPILFSVNPQMNTVKTINVRIWRLKTTAISYWNGKHNRVLIQLFTNH